MTQLPVVLLRRGTGGGRAVSDVLLKPSSAASGPWRATPSLLLSMRGTLKMFGGAKKMSAIVVSHSPYQLQGGRWVAQFELEFHDGRGITIQKCLEPRLELTFATRAEAMERSRDLARRWRDDNAPGEELRERKADE
jgi:hypothetical protein